VPRFNPNNYDPSVDSSPGAPSNGNLVLIYDKDGLTCRCGCGQTPKNPKRSFVQGHDARLKGALIRAAATDTKVEVREGGKTAKPITAMAAAKAFGWDSIVGKAKAAYADKATAAAERAKAAEARKVASEKAKAEKAKATAARKAEAAKKATAKKAAAAKAAKASKATKATKATSKKASAPKADAPPKTEVVEGTEVSA
jgi:hypothetical protein